MRRDRARSISLAAVSAAIALGVAACGTGNASTSNISANGSNPITVGFSVSLNGDFAADGLATLRGYQLWASDLNRNGGLLGRQVKLVYLNDKSDEKVTVQDYQQLIQSKHVDLTLAPFSTLLTHDAAQVTEKAGYALPAGSAVGQLVYALKDPYLFSVSVPAAQQLQPFASWVKSLPPGERPKTAAYPQVDDPFADPPVQTTQAELQNAGIRTVYSNGTHPADSGLGRIAQTVANRAPDLVVLGSVDVPGVATFVHAFQAANYTPKIFIATGGPDQGQAFINAVGRNGSEAVMVPNGWYGQEQNALSHVMVQDYIAKFGGTVSDINADVAEAYSAGETLAAAVAGTQGTDNAAIKQYLHTHVVQTAEGPALFDNVGKNVKSIGNSFIFQWVNARFTQVLGPGTGNGVHPEVPKPHL
jgi:branched-chain amino acid transport system substrate-binding protein